MTSRRRDDGFSLIELIVLVGIIGVLAALAGMGLSELRDKARFEDAIKTFESELSEARRLAKSEDESVPYRLAQVDGTWTVEVENRKSPLPKVSFSEPLAIELEAPYGTAVYPSGSSASVEVSLGRRSATIHVVGVLARTVVIR